MIIDQLLNSFLFRFSAVNPVYFVVVKVPKRVLVSRLWKLTKNQFENLPDLFHIFYWKNLYVAQNLHNWRLNASLRMLVLQQSPFFRCQLKNIMWTSKFIKTKCYLLQELIENHFSFWYWCFAMAQNDFQIDQCYTGHIIWTI